MKVFFGIDLTEDKKNERMGGEVFLTDSVPEEQMARIEKHDDNVTENLDRKYLPLPMRMLKLLSGLATLLAAVIVIAPIGEETISYKEFAGELWWIFAIGIICGVVYGLLCLWENKNKKAYEESDENKAFERESDNIDAASRVYLGIPDDSVKMDVFLGNYKLKRGNVVYSEFNPINMEIDVFVDGANLCFADAASKYTVPFSDIRCVKEIKKNISFLFWNKDEEPDKGEYKQYKIRQNNFGYTVKYYYALVIERDGEEYDLHFPPYELSVIEKLTGVLL